ncbi:MAG: amidohydrolase family protein [Fuerstiella sp.]
MLPICRLLILVSVLLSGTSAGGDQSSDHAIGLRTNVPTVRALQHATVVVRPGEVVHDATIVIRDGKIESVVAAGPVPDDARVLNMTGRMVYAGFIDSYSEVSLSADRVKDTAGYWNPNVVPQLSVARNFLVNSQNEELRKQGIVAQLRAPSQKIIRGRSALVSTGSADPNTAILSGDVAQHMELTVARRGGTVYPGSPMGAVALSRQALYDARWYQDAWNAAEADPGLPRPEVNDALAALQPVLTGDMPVVIETSNELFFLRADRFAGEFGLNLIIRGNGYEYRRLEDIAATRRTVLLPLNFAQAPNVSTAEVARNVTLESLLHWDLAPENPARMAAAGIRFAFCTDKLSKPGDFLKSLRTAVKRGLSKDDALRALTQTPARLFQVDQQLGTIEAGRLASFVITDGDLFDSETRIQETWVAGERFEHAPSPLRDLTGQFEVRLQKQNGFVSRFYLQLNRDDTQKLTGRVASKPIVKGAKQDTNKNRESEAKSDVDAKPDADDPDSSDAAAAEEEKNQPVKLKHATLRDFTATGQFEAKGFGGAGAARLTLVFSNSAPQSKDTVAVGQVIWPDGRVAQATAVLLKAADTQPDKQNGNDADAAGNADDKNSKSDEENKDEETEADQKSSAAASFAVNYPLGAFGREHQATAVGLTAFVHATIWTCGPEGVIDDGTLLIDNGRIVSVGRQLKLPEGVIQIDAKGMHITPGIIDCHSHMATDGGVNESTQAITCEVRIGDFIDSDDISIYRQLAGGVTTSNILHGSANPIGGQNQVIKLRWGKNPEQMKMREAPPGVKFALGENVKHSNRGDDFTTRYPQTRMGVEQMFRDAFHAAHEYAARMDAYHENRRGLPPRRDLELDALREIVEQRRWIHCHSYRQDEILALIRILDEFDITIGTFQHILEGYKVADELARHGAMASAFSDWWAYKFEVYDAIPYAGAVMHDAGVVVSFNSDDAELATHLNQEAAKAVKYGGLTEAEALKFVTLNPAKQLRIDSHVGSLEPGKHADFVIWNGPPLSNFTRCQQTWIDGARYFDRAEDAAARKQVFDMRNTLIQKILTSGAKMRGVGEDDDDPSSQWLRYDEFCHASGHDHVK